MEAQQLLKNTCQWTEKLYDMAYDPNDDEKNEVLQYVKSNGKNMIVYIEYSYKQLGLTDEWLHKMYDAIGNPLVVKREILLQRLRGSSESPYEQEDIEYITSMIHPVHDEMYLLEHFRFDIYKPLEKHIPYLVGVDCSTGTMGDSNAITIINPNTEEPDAEFQCPFIGETLFEKLLQELYKVIPRAVFIIERNSIGDGIIDHLLHSGMAHRLYFDKNKDLLENNIQALSTTESMLKRQAIQKRFYGVYTEGSSREDMFAILNNRMAEYKDKFITKNITDDITRLVRTKSGKIEASSGFHDDSIMSYLIAMYVWYHGNNLNAFGVVKGKIDPAEMNKGTKRPEDYKGSDIIPDRDLDIMAQQAKVRKENDYQAMMAKAIREAQQQTLALSKKKLINNQILDNTPDDVLDDMYDEGSIPLDFFNELNGF